MNQTLIKTTDHGIDKFKTLDGITSDKVAKALGVRHSDLMKSIKKAMNYHKKIDDNHRTSFNPIFKEWKYKDSYNRLQKCKIMNEDGVKALIKVIDTQEAYNYFALLMSEFKSLSTERRVRVISKKDSHKYTDSLKELRGRLVEAGTTQKEAHFYSTVQRKIHKKATGRAMPKGGIDHCIFTKEEETVITVLRRLVGRWVEEDKKLPPKEARKSLYDRIEAFSVVSITDTSEDSLVEV